MYIKNHLYILYYVYVTLKIVIPLIIIILHNNTYILDNI